MSTKIKLGFGGLSVLAVMSMIGCGGQASGGDLDADSAISEANLDSARKHSHPEFYACQADSDCVAIEQASCCPNGYLVAVNADEVQAYQTKYACENPPAVCPLYVVKDTRVAQCDFTQHQCQMIDPTQIRCGGFIDPSRQHQCPTGFTCQPDQVSDVPGTCVASPQ